MNKTIFIIRHAKAELHSFNKQDFKRNLIGEGIDRAKIIAKKLNEQLSIDQKTLFISSSANRAKQTAELFADELNYPQDNIRFEEEIYEASAKEILTLINSISDDCNTILLFGHNPGISAFVNYCCDTYISLRTSECAEIRLLEGIDFTTLSHHMATLNQLISEE
ncbi:SixA phosphatase family protein [Sphingobacterium hungaricum]|nr:histidine phosphatase family protein [Sphingobacterium hungaricum]